MMDQTDRSGQSALTPGPGSDSNLISREEFNKVVSQRDRVKEELRAIRDLHVEAEKANRMLQTKLERELENKNLSEQRRDELTSKLGEIEGRYSSDKELLERRLSESQTKLNDTEKKISDFNREKLAAEEESEFMQAARRASYSHDNAETLLGYLRGQGRLRSVPVYDDGDPRLVRGYRHEVECDIPREDGPGYEKKALPLDAAMPYLKMEKKILAPAMASGGFGSKGSDGPPRPGILNRGNMTVDQYRASRNPANGEVRVQ